MSDTLMAIIGIFLAVILMFIFPIMEIAGKGDEMSQTVVQVAVSDFVNAVSTKGKITQTDYNALVQKIFATGNVYDIQIEAQILDDNPRRVTATNSNDLIGEYKYYSVYTNTIMDLVNSDEGEYILKKDDYISVSVKNTNITIGTQLKNFMYKLIGKDTSSIGATASALVLNGGTAEIKYAENKTENIKNYPEKNVTLKSKQLVTVTEQLSGNLEVIVVLDCEHDTMPFHNNKQNSQIFLEDIINSIRGKGNVAFILTSDPSNVYTDLNNLSWIYDAKEDTTEGNYAKAIRTAINYVRNKSGIRTVVMLSYWPNKAYFSSAINALKSNQSGFDLFFNAACCRNLEENEIEKWQNAIGEDKAGGALIGSTIGTRFSSLVNRNITTKELKDLPVTTAKTNDLIINLGNLDTTSAVEVKVNNITYTIGKNLPSYVVYFDAIQSQYVIDLKLIGELLDMTIEDWENADIEISYVIQ